MAVDPELAELMVETITVAPFVSRSISGTATYGEPASYSCKVDWHQQVFPDPTGRQVVSRGIVYLPDVYAISTEDKLTLPDGISPPLLGVQDFQDENGPAYTTLIFQ